MKSLTEDEVKTLMKSEAYQNRDNPHHEEINRKITQAWENLYPDDDRNENSANYYVWKSVGDSKIRRSHAERDGQVFCWDNPPEGGHPGEDYNCRCKAEKYIPPKDKLCEYDTFKFTSNHNYLSEPERRKALKEGKKIKLIIENSHEYDGKWPWYHSHTVGQEFVRYYSGQIEKYAKKHNVDVDLVKAVMYTENADGHKGSLNYIADYVGKSKSQGPMNIQGSLWSDMDGKNFNTKDAEQNIELSVLVLKRLVETIENPTASKAGSVWNVTATDKVTNFGARVGYNYKHRWWETPEVPNIISNKR